MTEAQPLDPKDEAAAALRNAERALRLVGASLPHLAGLARLVRIRPHAGVGVAAVGASGLILIEPAVFAAATPADALFVIAHELMHLALDTFGRLGDAPPRVGNVAHDYIINDMLREELEREPPFGGLNVPRARLLSFEGWIIQLSKGGRGQRVAAVWHADSRKGGRPGDAPPRGRLQRALEHAGLVEAPPQPSSIEPPAMLDDALDLLAPEAEQATEPEMSPHARRQVEARVRDAAVRAMTVAEVERVLDAASAASSATDGRGPEERTLEALRAAYATPWELSLQRWMDAAAPGTRTYARPSRREGDSHDLVLAGRRREAWTLHVLLDTSGSMSEVLPYALGAIAQFCEAAGVVDVHVVQCDTDVTVDEWIDVSMLAAYRIVGFGYSEMQPAMQRLADDPEVTAVLVLTDGWIQILEEEPPYRTLWALINRHNPEFAPPYGDVVRLPLPRVD